MKASVNTQYGPPEVLSIQEIEKPIPKKNEVLIRIKATTVNRTDCGFRKPEYLIVRLISGLFKPKNTVLGTELAGIIEEVGPLVTRFKVGDEIYGLNTYQFGTHAEYCCMPETKSIALKPKNLSFNEAASICDGAFLAYNYIKKIDFSTKPNILVNGASGAIGTAAVQLAHYFGATITAVCQTHNFELLKSLGANNCIDFTKEDFTNTNQQFDVVMDMVGKSSFGKCKKILKPKGTYFSSELGAYSQNIFLALFTPLFGGKKVLFPIPTDTIEDIEFFKKLIEEGKYKPIIDRTYTLEQIVEATEYVETGMKTGNVVIEIHA